MLEGRGGNNAAVAPRVVDGKEMEVTEKPVLDGDTRLFSSSSDENDDDNDETATIPAVPTPVLLPTPAFVPVSGKLGGLLHCLFFS
jgi:hypothetical protein